MIRIVSFKPLVRHRFPNARSTIGVEVDSPASEYRRNPLANEEKSFGVTLHRIDLKLDAGPIIKQVEREMSSAPTALEVALSMTSCVSPMLCELFSGASSLHDARKQDLSRRSYFGHPTRTQVRTFRKLGFCMWDRNGTRELKDYA